MILSNSPTTALITKWAYQKSNKNSSDEWQQEITTLENADLLLTLASDPFCPQRAAILKCLYFLVGFSASRHIDTDITKIKILLMKAKSAVDPVIQNWANRSWVILGDLKKFDYTQWCLGGFSEKDLPTIH
jgi:hypothetical protein